VEQRQTTFQIGFPRGVLRPTPQDVGFELLDVGIGQDGGEGGRRGALEDWMIAVDIVVAIVVVGAFSIRGFRADAAVVFARIVGWRRHTMMMTMMMMLRLPMIVAAFWVRRSQLHSPLDFLDARIDVVAATGRALIMVRCIIAKVRLLLALRLHRHGRGWDGAWLEFELELEAAVRWSLALALSIVDGRWAFLFFMLYAVIMMP